MFDAPSESLQTALNRHLRDSLPTVLGGLALLHVVFAALDLFLPPLPVGTLSSQGTWSIGVAVLLFGLWLLVRRRPLPESLAHPVAAVAAAAMLGKILDNLSVLGPLQAKADAALFIAGAGCFLLSRRWHAAICLCVLAAWFGMAAHVAPDLDWAPRTVYPFLTSIALSLLVLEVRLRTYSRFEEMIGHDHRLTSRLREAMDDLVRKDESRRESESRLQQIMDNSPAIMFIKDLEGRYLFVNRQHEKTFHVPNADIQGRSVSTMFPPEVARSVLEHDRQVVETGQPVIGEEVVPQDDGPHTYLSVKFPIRDTRGAVHAVCGIATDITDRQRAEAALRRSESRFRGIYESDAIGIIMGTFDGQITDANDAFLRMSGYDRGELPLRWDHMTPREYLPLDERAIEQMRATRTCQPYEKEYVRKDGTRLPLLLGAALLDAEGREVIAFVLDLTDRKQAEEKVRRMTDQLNHVSRLGGLGEMAAGIAHELHQPLEVMHNFARGAVRRLDRGRLSLEEARRSFQVIGKQALRAGDVIRGIRDLIGRRGLALKETHINDVVDDALALAGIPVREHRVELELKKGSGIPRVIADDVQLSQVVINLVLNAVQALAEIEGRPRRLTVETRAAGDGVEILVADNGPGLSDAVRDRLFEHFVTTKPRGLGLGLAMSKSIVDVHGGELRVTSHPDAGCTFRITLPPRPPERTPDDLVERLQETQSADAEPAGIEG